MKHEKTIFALGPWFIYHVPPEERRWRISLTRNGSIYIDLGPISIDRYAHIRFDRHGNKRFV